MSLRTGIYAVLHAVQWYEGNIQARYITTSRDLRSRFWSQILPEKAGQPSYFIMVKKLSFEVLADLAGYNSSKQKKYKFGSEIEHDAVK